jgi:hypothetical protein
VSWRLGTVYPKFGSQVLSIGAESKGALETMKRYWQFALVGVICLLVALLWAQPQRHQAPAHQSVAITMAGTAVEQSSSTTPASKPSPSVKDRGNTGSNDDQPLPGSSSSLPLLAVIGFGVLAGGITSAMRTR